MSELELLRGAIRRIQSLAGHPDAAQACRNILKECESVLTVSVTRKKSPVEALTELTEAIAELADAFDKSGYPLEVIPGNFR